jgi:hypothetical protein
VLCALAGLPARFETGCRTGRTTTATRRRANRQLYGWNEMPEPMTGDRNCFSNTKLPQESATFLRVCIITVGCVVIFVVSCSIISAWWEFSYSQFFGQESLHWRFSSGRLWLTFLSVDNADVFPGQPAFRHGLTEEETRESFGFRVSRLDSSLVKGLCWPHISRIPRPQYNSNSYTLPAGSTTTVVIPAWTVTLVLSTVFYVLLIRYARSRRLLMPLRCRVCTYDLRGLNSDICPECGTPIPEEQKQAIAKGATTP